MSESGIGRSRSVALRFLASPLDVNFGGKVHGGAVMKWIDQAAYTCAAGWTGCYCVTVYLGSLHLLAPIHVGDLVELRASVLRTGRTSMDIGVEVHAMDPRTHQRRRTGHCVIVFVALDDAGRPQPVPPWAPVSRLDLALQRYAGRLAEARKTMDAAMDEELTTLLAETSGR